MVLIQIIVDTLFWLGEHWQEATALGVINVVAIAVGKRVSIIQLKKLLGFDDRKEMQEFSLRQKAVLNNQRAIMRAMGVEELWIGNGKISSAVEAKNSKRSFLSSPVGMHLLNILRRVNLKMKEYLKKLGSRKFQALLTSLIVNLLSAVLFMTKTVDIDGVLNEWMPIINMTVATISTWVYILVEGGVDKANLQKAQNESAATSEPIDLSDSH